MRPTNMTLSIPGAIGLFGCITAANLCLALSPAEAARLNPRHHVACCLVTAGTPVEVELVDQVSTKEQKRGDTFAIRLKEPLISHGRVVLRAGTRGVGTVIDASGPGLGGKPAEMVLAANYLAAGSRRVELNALKLGGRGHDNSTPAQILAIGGIAAAPVGVVGIILPGGQVAYKPGTVAMAKVASDVTLASLGRPTRSQLAAVSTLSSTAASRAAEEAATAIAIPSPPAGEGQIVFFRAKSLMGTAQWFNVRENGKALGKLSNGAYFVEPETPGVHTFTAKLEPELKDHLKLQVDAGETYFVEGTLTGGLVLSAADLSPSTVAKFNKAAKHLKLAAAPEEKPVDQAANAGSQTSATPNPPSQQ